MYCLLRPYLYRYLKTVGRLLSMHANFFVTSVKVRIMTKVSVTREIVSVNKCLKFVTRHFGKM